MSEKQERELRMKLATLCMAVNHGREGDLDKATKNIIEYVNYLLLSGVK